jgi:hypothetical protein
MTNNVELRTENYLLTERGKNLLKASLQEEQESTLYPKKSTTF